MKNSFGIRAFVVLLVFTCHIYVATASIHGQRSESRGLDRSLLRVQEADVAPRSFADPVQAAVSTYKTNAELKAYLVEFSSTRCAAISKLTTIGSSVNGFPLFVLEISDKPGVAEPEPSIKMVANIHGDETLGRVLTIGLAEWLCANYEVDPVARRIVNKVHLFLLPSLNPDGFAAKDRYNAHNIDLNRNFPDRFISKSEATGSEEPETAALMNWSLNNQFTASLAFHGGALVASYPWDNSKSGASVYTASPDDATFKYLAKTYSFAHRNMNTAPNNRTFKNGITNGADWYSIFGGMQDWNYIKAGCMEITIELGQKYPAENELATLFDDNFDSLIQFIEKTGFGGVHGKVMVASGKRRGSEIIYAPLKAKISIEGINHTIRSSKEFGSYHRPLAPGNYTVVVEQSGYKTARANIVVPASGEKVVQNFILETSASAKHG